MALMALAMATERGLLMLRPSLRPMPGTDMVASMAMDSQLMVPMAVMVLAMAMERGLLMLRLSPRLMPGTDMAAFMATDSQFMADTATERGLPTLSPRLMRIMDMVAFTATDSQPMAAMAMVCGARSKNCQISTSTDHLMQYLKPNELMCLPP